MIYLESNSNDPCFNLAMEEYVFESLDKTQPYFMLWQNAHTIVVGKYQNTAEEVNAEYVDREGIKVVRRLSGGGAVYHDLGNLNFTFVVDSDTVSDFNFTVFVEPVIKALKRLGVTAQFNGRNDITIDDKKISGNSQYSKGGRVLHHGCIMLDSNLAVVENALRVNAAKYQSKSAKSVRSRVTTINANAPKRITMDEFKACIKEEVFASVAPQQLKLSEHQLKEIERLAQQKYATWEWTYGASPQYNVRKERKFDCGLVTAFMQVESGHIDSIRFYGDFFGTLDIAQLEQALQGLRLDESLKQRLESLNVDSYISGLCAQDLFNLILY